LRDLDATNAAAKSTGFLFAISLILPIFFCSGAWALAVNAAPGLPLRENYLEALSLGIMLLEVIALPIPYIFRWNWEAKYFGAPSASLAISSIVGIYPFLCILLYSSLPLLARLTIVILEAIIITRWCSRFVKIYKSVYADKTLFNFIYEEESTAIYYLQQGDKKVMEEILKFNPFPSGKYFTFSLLFGFSLVPFSSSISQLIGIPFFHVFFGVVALPMTEMFLGMATKGWLVYYFYPMKISRETKKPVYVDMSSQPLRLINCRSSLECRPGR
jgi:hypothetical protein